jgi:cytidylate kinase
MSAAYPRDVHPVIAIDGPAGSGKSSVSREVARRLGVQYLDTGAIYRALTWAVLQRGVDPADGDAVRRVAQDVVLTSGTDPEHPTITVDGVDVSTPIRGDDVTAAVSAVSAVPEVRARLVALQRDRVESAPGGIVVEGRDIGTVVLPDAPVKVFLTASPAVRAQRRAAQDEHERDQARDVRETESALLARDAFDSSRPVSPLTVADDAVVLDTTDMDFDEVVSRILELVAMMS